jgi:hypothetical protein
MKAANKPDRNSLRTIFGQILDLYNPDDIAHAFKDAVDKCSRPNVPLIEASSAIERTYETDQFFHD